MKKRKDYYYTPEEWSRSIGYGPVPDGRNTDLLDEECPELTKEQYEQIKTAWIKHRTNGRF